MDPYEEERLARFVEPVMALHAVLKAVQEDLEAAKASRSPQEHALLRDRAMNVLWPQNQGTPGVSFRWIVCFPNGECRQGSERTQEECERTVTKFLMEWPLRTP